MVRRWAVRPNPETGIADRQEVIEALMDGEALLHRAGGVLEVVVMRQPTDVPGEMVTEAAIFAWKDRTDAKPQPEVPAPQADPDPTPEALEERLEGEAEFLEEAEQGEDTSSMEPVAQ